VTYAWFSYKSKDSFGEPIQGASSVCAGADEASPPESQDRFPTCARTSDSQIQGRT